MVTVQVYTPPCDVSRGEKVSLPLSDCTEPLDHCTVGGVVRVTGTFIQHSIERGWPAVDVSLISFTISVVISAGKMTSYEKSTSHVATSVYLTSHVPVCISPVMYQCVSHQSCTSVYLTSHVPVCISPVMYQCVSHQSCTSVYLTSHVPVCISPVMYQCVSQLTYSLLIYPLYDCSPHWV